MVSETQNRLTNRQCSMRPLTVQLMREVEVVELNVELERCCRSRNACGTCCDYRNRNAITIQCINKLSSIRSCQAWAYLDIHIPFAIVALTSAKVNSSTALDGSC